MTRALGGCLGIERRRRTWHAAKSCGEMRAIDDPRMSEWGNPYLLGISPAEKIGREKRTRRTETSHVPGGKEINDTPLVVASERGLGQWYSWKNKNCLERQAAEGDSPVLVETMDILE